MWGLFAIAVAVTAAFVFVPGLLLVRATGASPSTSLQTAPLVSLPVYCIIAAVAAKAGAPCNWAIVFLPTLIIGALALAIASAYRRAKKRPQTSWSFGPAQSERKAFRAATTILCIAFGLIATAYVFLIPMGNPDAPMQTFDNWFHLNLTASFLQSGNWSMFPADLYADIRTTTLPPVPAAFYPAEFHTLCAMTMSALGVSVPLAHTAALTVIAALVFPLGMQALVQAAFLDKPWAPLFAVVTCLALIAVPWGLIIKWPLPPNALSSALVPAAAALFISAFENAKAGQRVAAGFLFVIGIISLAFAQPNGVFSLAAILAPYLVYQAWKGFGAKHLQSALSSTVRKIIVALTCAIVVALIWVGCFILPPLHDVVWYPHDPSFGIAETVRRAFTLEYMTDPIPWACTALMAFGAIYTLKNRRHFWVTLAFLFSAAIFIASAGLSSNGFLRHFLSGFWYADAYRVAAFAAIPALMLATLALAQAHELIVRIVSRTGVTDSQGGRQANVRTAKSRGLRGAHAAAPEGAINGNVVSPTAAIGAVVLMAAFALAAYPFNFDQLRETCYKRYHDPEYYTLEEQQFVQQAKDIIGEKALVLNDPFDGSSLGYALDNVNLYYREMGGYYGESEALQSATLRKYLNDPTQSEATQRALHDLGIQYILILDNNPNDPGTRYMPEYRNEWQGIDFASEAQPFLQTVLAQGDMVLLKVNSE